ncbi:hypothetical protein CPB86DRAFT_760748 [Serendipita vermifera]|nr:hypothetical protein CPB86DRAFT_760748 [Serendipita vermifera]
MPPTIQYHCTCTTIAPGLPPPPHLTSSSFAFHSLHNLYFCEECDAVRCNRCVSVEISGYYCPNCLFEVPSASVRAEKNRCARNCFLCPVCNNTLSVCPADPPEPEGGIRGNIQIPAVGEPPFFLYCNHCRWDSVDVGITFEKATGLALQLQKTEDSAPEILEIEKLKDYFEPALKLSQQQQQLHQASVSIHTVNRSPIQQAASLALSREIPSFKYSSSSRRPGASSSVRRGVAPAMPSPGTGQQDIDDPAVEYKPRITTNTGSGVAHDAEVEWLTTLGKLPDGRNPEVPTSHANEVASLPQRMRATQYSWGPSHSLRTVDLKPTRVPLRSKKSKRCPKCTHILIKPELKAQSTKWKIKLVAANYLPTIEVLLPTLGLPTNVKKTGKEKDMNPDDLALSMMLLPGRTYPFHLILANPLYDPISVRLSVQRSFPVPAQTPAAADPTAQPQAPARRPPYAISLPTAAFSIAAFAEAWEYEDEEDEEMFDDDDLGLGLGLGSRTPGKSTLKREGSKSKTKTVGILERKANTTKIGGEVVISKEGKGAVKFNMLVSYTYRSDEPEAEKMDLSTPSKSATKKDASSAAGGESMKTFSFYTVVDLGMIAPKELAAKAEKQEKRESVQTVGVYN